jgi:hypothetical protein
MQNLTPRKSFLWPLFRPLARLPRWRFPLATLFLLCLAGSALAATAPPPPDQNASAWLQALYVAVTSKQWGVLAGVGLIGIVYPLRVFGPDVFKTAFGGLVLAFAISLAGTLGAALAVGVTISWMLVASALATAATAAGLWEWIKAHIPGGATAAAASSIPSAKVVAS